ncbi:MAG TPA: MFS transporter [Xanthobacteraceae bacterium]|nr:MFS transporter [Xanthobacteraceae bacterium]
MTAAAGGSENVHTDDRLARRNTLILAVAQALGNANNIILISTGSIVGAMLAPNKALVTLPLSVYVVGLWLGTLPVGALSRRFGRRAAFQLGTACGVITGILCCLAMLWNSFLLFTIGAFFTGFYAAAQQAYRFAAADTASDAFRPKAISWVLAGGVGAAVLGPQIVIFTQDVWQPYQFAATYLMQSVVAVLAGVVLSALNIPRPPRHLASRRGRPLREIVRQPRFVTAVACAAVSYFIMNLLMTSAPLAMVMCGHSVRDATLGIQWHVLGMFVPSFFTGSLVARFGAERVVAVGLVLLAASAAVDLGGLTLGHFWIGLTLLGVGWNFAFIGATTMVTQCHRPEERSTVQSFNDFLVFGSMVFSSFGSGGLLAIYGWNMVNQIAFPILLIAAALLGWLLLKQRARTA